MIIETTGFLNDNTITVSFHSDDQDTKDRISITMTGPMLNDKPFFDENVTMKEFNELVYMVNYTKNQLDRVDSDASKL